MLHPTALPQVRCCMHSPSAKLSRLCLWGSKLSHLERNFKALSDILVGVFVAKTESSFTILFWRLTRQSYFRNTARAIWFECVSLANFTLKVPIRVNVGIIKRHTRDWYVDQFPSLVSPPMYPLTCNWTYDYDSDWNRFCSRLISAPHEDYIFEFPITIVKLQGIWVCVWALLSWVSNLHYWNVIQLFTQG